jgi:hypothetical protein
MCTTIGMGTIHQADSVDRWWQRDIIGAAKLPLMVCFVAFVLTSLLTGTGTVTNPSGPGVASSGIRSPAAGCMSTTPFPVWSC